MVPRVDNRTDFLVHPQLLVGVERELLVAVVKATFFYHSETDARDGTFVVAPEEHRRGVRLADAPWEDPSVSSNIYPSDLCIEKPGTDVLLVAQARAPYGKAVPSFDAAIRLGTLSKVVRVFGPRVWLEDGVGLSKPRPVGVLDMRYDFAWGGSDDSDPEKFVEEIRNPVGRGISVDPAALTHAAAPQIEDPHALISDRDTKPPPAGVGPIGRHWAPRRERWGTFDDTWQENRAPLLPKDFDARANIVASSGLHATEPFRGGEKGALTNFVKGQEMLELVLPHVRLEIGLKVPEQETKWVRPHLDTVVLDAYPGTSPSPLALEMIWRASFVPPRRVEDATVIVSEKS